MLIGGGAGVGLVVAFTLWPRHLGSALSKRQGEYTFGNFIKVARDGRVTVAVPQVETGQGRGTALPQIVADELGAAWENVGSSLPRMARLRHPLDAAKAGRRMPASPRQRNLGAGVRAASSRGGRGGPHDAHRRRCGPWSISPADCEAADGFVISGARTFTFGELAEEASTRTPPLRPELRPASTSRLVGRPLPRLDGPARADGSLRFAADVRLPGMLYAAVRAAPRAAAGRLFPRRGSADAGRPPRRSTRRLDRRRR